MMWTSSNPPVARRARFVATLLLVLTAFPRSVQSTPPATGPATRRFEVRTLTPAAPLPSAYPALIEFELVNRSAEVVELFDINL